MSFRTVEYGSFRAQYPVQNIVSVRFHKIEPGARLNDQANFEQLGQTFASGPRAFSNAQEEPLKA
jgi:hypothetical protein